MPMNSVADLKAALLAPLPEIISDRPRRVGWDPSIIPLRMMKEGETPMPDLEAVCSAEVIKQEHVDGGTEIDVSHVMHNLTVGIWKFLIERYPLLGMHFRSDSAEKSGATVAKLRPDVCGWMRRALVFKAELKASSDDLDVAVRELRTKMKGWNPLALQGLPFLPCFAAAGATIAFAAVLPPTAIGRSPTVTELDLCFTVSTAVGRLHVLKTALNMLGVFANLRRKMPEVVLPLYERIPRTTGSITVYDDFVYKECVPAAAEVYELLGCGEGSSMTPNAIQVLEKKQVGNGLWRLKIVPVCIEHLPCDEAQLKEAIRAVLMALAYFHSAGFVHRDIRWPNILLDPVNGPTWRVCDFELAARDGDPLAAGLIAAEHLPPEISHSSPQYTAAGDVFCVGRLLYTWATKTDVELSPDAVAFAAALCVNDPTKRPTASAALRLPWVAS